MLASIFDIFCAVFASFLNIFFLVFASILDIFFVVFASFLDMCFSSFVGYYVQMDYFEHMVCLPGALEHLGALILAYRSHNALNSFVLYFDSLFRFRLCPPSPGGFSFVVLPAALRDVTCECGLPAVLPRSVVLAPALLLSRRTLTRTVLHRRSLAVVGVSLQEALLL